LAAPVEGDERVSVLAPSVGRGQLHTLAERTRESGLSARERSRQPEPWEHAVVEAGDGADPVAGEGEEEKADTVADAGRAAQIGPNAG
jgi:hypothetical protein